MQHGAIFTSISKRRVGYISGSDGTTLEATFAGDTDLNGRVDVFDLAALATHWQQSGYWSAGDFNYDGFVDVADLGALATNWQAGGFIQNAPAMSNILGSLGLPAVALPEPGMLAYLGIGSLIGVSRRCGR